MSYSLVKKGSDFVETGAELESGSVINSTGLKVNKNMNNCKHESWVLVLYTGGTIGMMANEQGALVPVPNRFVSKLREMQQMHDSGYLAHAPSCPSSEVTLVLPKTKEQRRVLYRVKEMEPLLDSSNMTMDDWINIANEIKKNYEDYDGFVVLHGTDTLSYTASALSFMLENLGKTVIITGSQVPIFEIRGDGVDNFLAALIIAGNYVIPEVSVFFGDKLFRGNRTIKVCSDRFDAFDSPNSSPIATVGIDIEVDYKNVFRPNSIEKFVVHSKLNRNVGLLRIFPSITTATVSAFLKPPIEGVVLQTYGAGNMPCNRKDLLAVLREATENKIIIINCTQCLRGTVSSLYETNKVLSEAGVTPGYDMTPDAALAKLSYVLSKNEWSIEYKRKMMESNLRGELTRYCSEGSQLRAMFEAVANAANLHLTNDVVKIRSVFLPAAIADAIVKDDLFQLEYLENIGGDLSTPNADLRTPLHIACCEGNVRLVKHILSHGASVHMKDRFDRTPLDDAISFDYHEIIKLLRKCGAHLRDKDSEKTAEQLCRAAASGNLKRLESYKLAGASLDVTDVSGRTPLHLAVLLNEIHCVQFLLRENVKKDVVDILGKTPLAISEDKNLTAITKLLNDCFVTLK